MFPLFKLKLMFCSWMYSRDEREQTTEEGHSYDHAYAGSVGIDYADGCHPYYGCTNGDERYT